MKEMYESGLSANQIAKAFGISTYKVLRNLREVGIIVINTQNTPKWSVNDAINDYNNGLSLSQIAKKHNVSISLVSRHFKKLGVTVVNHQNKTKFDANTFDQVNTEEKAYWLGFIYADGYVSSRDNGFELSLSLKDLEHLKKFAKFLKHDDNVKTDSVRCRFSVSNKHFKNRLIELGVKPKKSLTLEFPKEHQVSSNLLPHFIRGYFDGDGCILTKKTSVRKLNVSILGTKNMLLGIIKKCNILTNLLQDKRHASDVFYISLGIKKSKTFLDYIYNGSSIYLNRKREKYEYYCRSEKKFSELLSSKNGEF